MISKIMPSQIDSVWNVIKYAACKADEVDEKDTRQYNLNLLYDLLNEKVICYLSHYDGKVHRVGLFSFVQNPITNENGIYFKCLYSFVHGDLDVFREELKILWKSFKDKNYKYISTTTNNERVIELCKQFDFSKISTNYKYIL
jgi:hypothetical protein